MIACMLLRLSKDHALEEPTYIGIYAALGHLIFLLTFFNTFLRENVLQIFPVHSRKVTDVVL